MLSHDNSVIVGLSGGADSVALLRVLLELREELNLDEIFAAHINHNLRGDESDSDEIFVRNLCDEWGVTLKIFHADVKTFAEKNKIGIEEAARNLRYEFLEQARREFAASNIAVGHNLDDNAETVIMNLCRGAGIKGLGGIPPVNGAVIRPLINVPRLKIEEYLRTHKIKYLTDSSNLSNDFTRNRVRNIILPSLENEVNPNTKKTIARTASLLRLDEDFLEISAQEVFENCAEKSKNLSLNIKKLTGLHPAVSQRVIRVALLQTRKDITDITYTHITAVLKLANGQTGREVHLPGIIVTKEYEKLIFTAQIKTQQVAGFNYLLQDNSSYYFPEIEKTILLSFISEQTLNTKSALSHCTKIFSYDKITKLIYLRTRLPGDKISFRNAEGKIFTKKLQDYFTDEKIPKTQRDSIPLIAHGNEILWILDGKNRVNAKYEAEKNEKIICVSVEEGAKV